MPAKLVVTARDGGSQISLVGASGKALLTSVVFTEPRAKGATLRALKGMLGENVVVEDHTPSASRGRATAGADNGPRARRASKSTKKSASRRSRAPRKTAAKAAAASRRTTAKAAGTTGAAPAKRARKSSRGTAKSKAAATTT